MSITISILNDEDKSLVETYECDCLYTNGGMANASCICCEGTGQVRWSYSKWQLNMSCRNFGTLWSSLGLSRQSEGTIHPLVLKRVLDSFIPDLAVRSPFMIDNVYDFGISNEQIITYVAKLLMICDEALKREELVCWN